MRAPERNLLSHLGAMAALIGALLFLAGPVMANPRVLVGHLAPFADSIDNTSVTVRVNGANVLENFKFGQTTGDYVDLPAAGTYQIDIVPTGSQDPAITATVDLAAFTDYTALAVGDGVNQPLQLRLLSDDNAVPSVGTGKVRVGHFAPFASDIDATRVSIRDANNNVVGGLADVPYDTVSGYLEVPAATYDLKIATVDGSTTLLDLPPFNLGDGDLVNLFAAGDAANIAVTAVAVPVMPVTRVLVGHLAPFAATAAETSVSIRLNGTTVLEDVRFGEFSNYLRIAAPGDYTVDVVPTGSDSPAITATLSLAAATDYSVLAIGDGGNQPLELFPLMDDNSSPAAGNVRVRIGHLAPFAADLNATRVSIRDAAGNVVGGLADVPYRVVSDYLQLPAGTYDIKVSSVDGATTFIDPLPVSLTPGTVASLYANGGANGQPLGVLASPGGALPLRNLLDPPAPYLQTATQPSSRAVQIEQPATAFVMVMNTGNADGSDCSIAPNELLPVDFSFAPVDAVTGVVNGPADIPFDLDSGESQPFVVGLTPSDAFASTRITFNVRCAQGEAAAILSGVNTLLLTASSTPLADVVTLAATLSGDHIVTIPGPDQSSAFAVAAVNVGGAADTVTVMPHDGGAGLPLELSICATDAEGQCLAVPSPNVMSMLEVNATASYAIFATALGEIEFDPANKRIFVEVVTSSGIMTGEVSVAVRTR